MSDLTEPHIGKFHRNAPDTEREAAIAVYPRTGTQCRAVLDLLLESPRGATDWEISERLNISRTGAGARRNELMERGYVEDSGHRRVGPYGARGIVWVVTKQALEDDDA